MHSYTANRSGVTARVGFGHTLLQHAGEKLNEATTEQVRRRWREFSELYRAAGATDDLLMAIHGNDPAGVRKLLEKSRSR